MPDRHDDMLTPRQKMTQLRLDADEAVAKVEELQTKVKTLEQENLSKEQEITSLQHKNGLLESEVEKLETAVKDFKKAADESTSTGTQNETLQRRLQLLEEEAEDADKTLREANEKCVIIPRPILSHFPNPSLMVLDRARVVLPFSLSFPLSLSRISSQYSMFKEVMLTVYCLQAPPD